MLLGFTVGVPKSEIVHSFYGVIQGLMFDERDTMGEEADVVIVKMSMINVGGGNAALSIDDCMVSEIGGLL